jgi:hypothetical protein
MAKCCTDVDIAADSSTMPTLTASVQTKCFFRTANKEGSAAMKSLLKQNLKRRYSQAANCDAGIRAPSNVLFLIREQFLDNLKAVASL